jgi:tetratricopeptide (TPR) repeat protein
VRRLAGLTAALVLTAALAAAQDPPRTARALMASWHQDPAGIDRARAMLEQAAAATPTGAILTELARAWFLVGDIRATADAEKVIAYERGAEVGKHAIAAAPNSDDAHLWYAINTGKVAETRGVVKAVTLLGTVREESDTVLRLNPRNVDGLVLAGGILANLPSLMGGDRARAEAYFKRALEVDSHKTSARIELARLYMASRRWADARGELLRVLDESQPSDVARWTVRDVPRARTLLGEVGVRDPRPAGILPVQSP